MYNLNITDICHFSETDYVSTEQQILEMEDIVRKTYQRTRGELWNFDKCIVISYVYSYYKEVVSKKRLYSEHFIYCEFPEL